MENMIEDLKHLTSIPALSCLEDHMIREMRQRLEPFANALHVDRIGNLTATFNGRSEDEPTMLVFAHMDELGLMVSRVEENGFLRFERIGGVPEKTLRGQFVDVFTTDGQSHLTGFIGTHAHHLTPSEAKFSVPNISEMYIDLGLSSKQEVLSKGIDAGSAVTYHPNFRQVSEHRITSKALDNRIGIYLLLKLAEHLHQNQPAGTVYLVASVQEEFNIRGVIPAFERLEPDASICLDIGIACDTPDLKNKYNISLGKGPMIMHLNFHGRGTLGGLIPNPKLRQYMEVTMQDLEIPFQREVIIGEITDDAFSQLSGTQGTAMAHLSIPMRYSHSPIETSDVRDIEAGVKALNAIVSGFDSRVDLRRGV